MLHKTHKFSFSDKAYREASHGGMTHGLLTRNPRRNAEDQFLESFGETLLEQKATQRSEKANRKRHR